MSPALTSPKKPDTVSGLTEAGVKHTIKATAPSIAVNGNSTGLQELDASKITFTRNPNPKTVPKPNSAEIAKMSSCTDHMITATWGLDSRLVCSVSHTLWTILDPTPRLRAAVRNNLLRRDEILPRQRRQTPPLPALPKHSPHAQLLPPASPFPAFPPAELQKLIETLVAVEGEKWLPKSRPESFMYLRPTMIATEPSLGVQKPNEVLLYIIACCFPDFNDPAATLGADASNVAETKVPGLKLLASQEDTIRAWPGGFGFAKVGANYGPSLLASDEARLRGFNQILWLFGPDCEVTEAGASNFFLVWKTREGRMQLVTAPLGDQIILPGVTRRSVLELARERFGDGLEVVERKFVMREVEEAVDEGRLVEAFAAGTAYFIMPISLIHFRGHDLQIPTPPLTTSHGSKLKQWLVDIMYGNEAHEWGVVVEERRLDT